MVAKSEITNPHPLNPPQGDLKLKESDFYIKSPAGDLGAWCCIRIASCLFKAIQGRISVNYNSGQNLRNILPGFCSKNGTGSV